MTTGQTTIPGKLKPHLALIFANVLFGMNFSFYVSIIHHYMDFEDLFFFRVAFAAVCFVPWTFFSQRYRIPAKDFVKILIPTVLVIYGHEFMMLWGAEYTLSLIHISEPTRRS